MSNLRPTGCMWPRLAMNAAQHKIVNLLKTFFFAHQFSLVFVYLMCGWRQLFFFQCGPEMPKDRAPLLDNYNTIVFVSCVALRCYKAKTSLGNRNFSDPLQSHGPTFVYVAFHWPKNIIMWHMTVPLGITGSHYRKPKMKYSARYQQERTLYL